ncbi:hypothetical protein I7I50_01151 [Histoplasma capsulatum G186AR]|uniref:Uncharacterized protein n=1 Tax=Ajellomyces capsulatus TaxID=5037 RepID=A0A8H7YYX1_AJECA|nr:hypothetical protein I7I52_09026 [Histoplasma capsulatum]QSS73108.1 hypothetical protein I7I50_01151 [Histoplasma capsulatum G186AR]
MVTAWIISRQKVPFEVHLTALHCLRACVHLCRQESNEPANIHFNHGRGANPSLPTRWLPPCHPGRIADGREVYGAP